MEKISLTDNIKVVTVSQDEKVGVFDIDGLYKGYGLTIGNALRRVLLSSIPGAAVTSVKIKGVGHEFSTIEGVMEVVVEICLNLKKIRFQFPGETGFTEPEILTLKAKGEGEVTAADIEESGRVTVLNKEQKIATITKKGVELEMELSIEKGFGYVPVETLKGGNSVAVGTIQLDALFSPVVKVTLTNENMRVGDRTDFNRLRILIETDGSIDPKSALEYSINIMIEQLKAITGFEEGMPEIHSEAGDRSSEEEKDEDLDSKLDPEFLKTRIESLNLSARTLNALSGANIRTVGGVARKHVADLLEIDGIGDKGITEIRDALGALGLSLKE
jgi:DNA-directed RNA polymerase subunit alpha